MSNRVLSGVAVIATAVAGLSWATSQHDRDTATAERTAAGGRPTVAASVDRVRVASVIDGDTIRVATLSGAELGRVRLLGINAPEVDHGDGGAQCYGETATSILRSLTPVGSKVMLRSDPTQVDRDVYGRLLRYVETSDPDFDVDEELLRRGAARIYESHPAVRRAQRYLEAGREARHDGHGLWGRC